jgi:hypothetical protein
MKLRAHLAAGTAAVLFAAADGVWNASRIESTFIDVVKGGGYFPVLIKLDNGEIGAAVRGGAPHVGPGGRLDWVRSNDGGRTWTRTLLADSEMDDRNPAVGQLRDGTLVVSYTIDRSYRTDGKRVMPLHRDSIWTVHSKDRGRSWSAPRKSPVAVAHGASPYGRMVQVADGTLLMNVYHERGAKLEHETSYVYRSRDGGITWGDETMIADHFNETSLTLLPDGRLLAAARSHLGQYLSTTTSSDYGRTWSAPKRITRDREHPADVIVLGDGRLLLVHGERNRPFGVRALLSRNLGLDWGPETIILAADSHNTDTGYPSSVEIGSGTIVTLYYAVDGDPSKMDGAFARAVIWNVPR